jgi:hypothetical protein
VLGAWNKFLKFYEHQAIADDKCKKNY